VQTSCGVNMNTLLLASLLLLQIVGGELTYTVQKGDSLTSIGGRFGMDTRVLAESNSLRADKLATGQILNIDNRHIIPPSSGGAIVVNVPQRMLFHFTPGAAPEGYPIAAGRASWRTQIGDFQVARMEEDPTWDVPVSIQNEMRRNGKPVLTHVPPSPENPLGQFWIGLSIDSMGIHGTNAPSSIYHLVTHGCIRLHPDDIRTLFPKVNVGMRGRVIYEPVLVAYVENEIFIEVHPDAYGMGMDPLAKILDAARAGGFTAALDMSRVAEVIRKRDGIARNVTHRQ
jgi:L,D-transpeptidase ErfK/SrfK